MKIIEKIRDIFRAILYAVTFKLLFTLLKAVFNAFVNILYAGFFYLFFYALFGAALVIFFKFEPVFWDIKTRLFAAGFVFWTVVSIVAVIRKINLKIYELNKKRADEKAGRINKRRERSLYYFQRRYEQAERRELRRRLKAERRLERESLFRNDGINPWL
ncbi:MAG: hypothetical protein LBP79_00390 [Clostridiales bacterium]|jgi:hypothetical protein|nr:hypothetical protein [Clostridiales bacterium]